MSKLLSVESQKNKFYFNCFLFLLFLLWNHWQPITADDYDYIFSNVTKETYFQVIKLRYFNWSARFTADTLIVFFLNEDWLKYTLPILNIINSLAVVGIVNLLTKFIFIKNYTWKQLAAITILYIGFFVASGWFAQDFMWKTVTIQYTWGLYLFLFIFWRFYSGFMEDEHNQKAGLIGYFLGGLFLGAYNEVYIAIVFDIYISTLIIWYLFKKNYQQLWQAKYFSFLLGVTISGIALITAPGNYARQATQIATPKVTNILVKFLMTYVQFFRYGYHLAFAIIIIVGAIWLYKNRKSIPSNTVAFITFLIILLNIHIISFIGIAYFAILSGRIILVMDTLLFLLIVKMALAKFTNKIHVFYNYLLILLSITIVGYVSYAYFSLHQLIKLRQATIIDKHYKVENFQKTYEILHIHNNTKPLPTSYEAYDETTKNSYLPQYKVGRKYA